jgi:hypothetical protein
MDNIFGSQRFPGRPVNRRFQLGRPLQIRQAVAG